MAADNWNSNTPGFSEVLSALEIKQNPDKPVVDSRHVRGGAIYLDLLDELETVPKAVLKPYVTIAYVAENNTRYTPTNIPETDDPVVWQEYVSGGSGGGSSVSPATQSQVNSGTGTDSYVAPATLLGWKSDYLPTQPLTVKSVKINDLIGAGTRVPQLNPDGSLGSTALLVSQLALVVNYGVFALVTTNGNDIGASIGRLDTPFATIQAAADALMANTSAQSRLLVIMPGNYTQSPNMSYNQANIPDLLFVGATLTGNLSYSGQYTQQRKIIGLNSSISGTLAVNYFAAGATVVVQGFNSINRLTATHAVRVDECTINELSIDWHFTESRFNNCIINRILGGGLGMRRTRVYFYRCTIAIQGDTYLSEVTYANTFDECTITLLGAAPLIQSYIPGVITFKRCKIATERAICAFDVAWASIVAYGNVIQKLQAYVSPYVFGFVNGDKVRLLRNVGNMAIVNPALTYTSDSLVYGNDEFINADLNIV